MTSWFLSSDFDGKSEKKPLRLAVAALGLTIAFLARVALPELPPFLLSYPAVGLAAFLCGRAIGYIALAVAAAFVIVSAVYAKGAPVWPWDVIATTCFLGGGALLITIVDLYDNVNIRYRRERNRLQAALRAADAAVWEITPLGELFWDENFYRLVGLDPQKTPPATEQFLAMVHPEDRERMAEARRMIDLGLDPRPIDEYRLTRPDGRVVWLENHRTRVIEDEGAYIIGITQDVTRRKQAEERISALLREASHRAKNLFSVVIAVARETRHGKAPDDFLEAFGQRVVALARSHDLLVTGDWQGTSFRELVIHHLEPFGAVGRSEIDGPDLSISSFAAQYLGMAFHELATNAAKHGALSTKTGKIRIGWQVCSKDGMLRLNWSESGSAPPERRDGATGFGTKVLRQLVPAALSGESTLTLLPDGLMWTLTSPWSAIVNRSENEPEQKAP